MTRTSASSKSLSPVSPGDGERRPSILFVDDEQNVLDGLRRMLRHKRHEWDMYFASSGQDALKVMAESPCEAIVSDVRMPGMDGAELLNETRRRYPATIRFILSGHADAEMILRTVGPTHRFLTKPCDSDVLINAITTAIAACFAMNKDNLGALVSGTTSLPSTPELYADLKDLLGKNDIPIEKMAEIIRSDVAMSAEILHVVNSSFFGPKRQIESIDEALKHLGVETIRAIILSEDRPPELSPEMAERFRLADLQKHSSHVARLAGMIMGSKPNADAHLVDSARIAGLLHDIGKLVLVANMKDDYEKTIDDYSAGHMPLYVLEESRIATTHAEVGGYLLDLWDLPADITAAVFCHHHPNRSVDTSFSVLTAVHVANVLDHELASITGDGGLWHVDEKYLVATGGSIHLDEWRAFARECAKDEEE